MKKVKSWKWNKNKEKLGFLQKMLTYDGVGKLLKLVRLRAMFHVNQ